MPSFDRLHDRDSVCPGCSAIGLEHFYQVHGVPTSSNLLMSSRQEAVDWPRGELRLAYCAACGTITNTAFDPSTQLLTARYEATQACSPTFGKFARQLAQRWIEHYRLEGKTILEIGCGQGEFIVLMCDLAPAEGWGIDPIVNPSRHASGRVRFVAEKYGTQGSHIRPDFVVCRHTLEHIADIEVFLRQLRAGLDDLPGTVLAIEVPDNARVMAEAAFWDIYYEHCSYFDTSSLLNVLQHAGFKPIAHRLEFAGQYLIAESKPDIPAPVVHPVGSPVDSFVSRCAEMTGRWHHLISQSDGSTVLWGSGSKAVGFLTTLGLGAEIAAVVDINPVKQGTFLPGSGHEIVSPEKLCDIRPETIIVMNPVYLDEIRQSLRELRLAPELIALQ